MIDLYRPGQGSPGNHLRKTDVPSLALSTLMQLQTEAQAGYRAYNDTASRSHFLDCANRIESALDNGKK